MSIKPLLAPDMYRDTLIELRLLIENEFGSLQAFAAQHNFDIANLYKIFNQYTRPDARGKSEMSVGLFLRINHALGVITNEPTPEAKASKLSLREYLEIDNNVVFRSILSINFSKPIIKSI